MAFYTLALAVVPCNDVHEDDHGVTVVHQSADDHEEHNDACAPFCHCSCCQCFIVLTQPKTTQTLFIASHKSFSFYSENFLSYDTVDHWQPPRLG